MRAESEGWDVTDGSGVDGLGLGVLAGFEDCWKNEVQLPVVSARKEAVAPTQGGISCEFGSRGESIDAPSPTFFRSASGDALGGCA